MMMRVLQFQWWWRASEWSSGIKATCCGLFGSLLLISALLCGDGYELNILVFTVNSFWSEDWNQLVIFFFSCAADYYFLITWGFFSLIGIKAPGVIFRYYFIMLMLLLLFFFSMAWPNQFEKHATRKENIKSFHLRDFNLYILAFCSKVFFKQIINKFCKIYI